MKKICSCLVILTYFTSCSDDIDTNVIDSQNAISALEINTSANRIAGEMPANSDNPFENAGHVYDEMLTAYYASGLLPTGIAAITAKVKAVADVTVGYNALKGSSYRDVQQEWISYIINHPTTCIADITNGTGLSASGKLLLASFITRVELMSHKETEFLPIYNFICDYETDILANPLLTAKDKKVILTVTSISRYSVSKAKKRPKKNTDPDWTVFIGNLTAGTYGGDNDTAEAISTALVTGIAQN
jgi:hypothetical protein